MATIQLKSSTTTGNVPTLAQGEVAINEADGLLYFRDSGGAVTCTPLVGVQDNLIVNGGMEISQEKLAVAQTSVSTGKYIVDMFGWSMTGAGVFTLQQLQSAARAELKDYIQVNTTTADASIAAGDKYVIYTAVEGYRIRRLAWGAAGAVPVSLGFWCKAHRTGTYSGSLQNGGVTRSYPFNFTINAADTWEYKKIENIPGDTTGSWDTTNGAGFFINWAVSLGSTFLNTANAWAAGDYRGVTGTINGVAATSDLFSLTGVSLIPGKYAVPAVLVPKIIRPFDQELAACQRYFEKSYNHENAPGSTTQASGGAAYITNASAGGSCYFTSFKVHKRTTPSVTIYSAYSGTAGQYRNGTGGGSDAAGTVFAIGSGSANEIDFTTGANSFGYAQWVADSRF